MDDRIRVAFIDDSESLRSVVLEVVSEAGMDVYVAERESIDLAHLAQWHADVVVIDPQGGIDASRAPFAVAFALRDDPSLADVPIVFVANAWTLWQHEAEVQMVRPVATLTKPFHLGELVDAVRQAARPCDGGVPPGGVAA
jgi:DNA-binding response OmpR family regulator